MKNLAMMVREYSNHSPENREKWIRDELLKYMSGVSKQMKDANVLMYFSTFLQKPEASNTSMMLEDINGVMNGLYGMDYEKDLAVILHTPGGDLRAIEQFINYIHSKFKKVTAIVPVMSMSAGSMFALSCDEIIISKAGQLGPTDPQIRVSQGTFSVKEIKAQFDLARDSILENPKEAYVWTPILQYYGPALYMQAIEIEKYAKTKIREWLKNKGKTDKQIKLILDVFYEKPHFHGERIDYDIMSDKSMGLNVRLLEDNQEIQNEVLQAYHVASILADESPLARIIASSSSGIWAKKVA